MATKPIPAALDVAGVQHGRFADSIVLADYWALTKPEVDFLIAITTAAGLGSLFRLACGACAFSVDTPAPHSPRHCPRGEWSR